MKAWITKYALSTGIDEVEGRVSESCPTILSYGEHRFHEYANGKDWHKTKEAAIARAEEMRVKKIASLKKQIVALEKLTFGA